MTIPLLALAMFLTLSAPAAGATRQHFSCEVTGDHASSASGTVLVDGDSWRIDYDTRSVTDMTALIGRGADLIAVNDANQTWFRLKSRRRLAIDNSLFTYGPGAVSTSKVRISRTRSPETAESWAVIRFSYRIQTHVSTEIVSGEVWGEIRMIATPASNDPGPWQPWDLTTGLPDVDARLHAVLTEVRGSPSRVTLDVSRKLEGGVALHQVITRSIDPPEVVPAQQDSFALPSTYRNQEPVIGMSARP